MKKTIFIGFFLSLICAQSFADTEISNCVPSGPADTCKCDGDSGNTTGTVYIRCENVTCAQFAEAHKPQDCEEGMRAVICGINHPVGVMCNVEFPRVAEDVVAKELCNDLVSSGAHYSKINSNPLCVPANSSSAPYDGWELVSVSEE